MAKEKTLILNGVRDHVVSHIIVKYISQQMWEALATMYEGPSKKWNMYLEEKLRCMRMQKGEHIELFLTRLQDVQDHLASVGSTPQPTKLV